MAKYIGTYATSGDVQTALNNQELSRPFIAYTTDNEDVIFGAAADKAEVGDIVVYSVADDLLHYIKQADYSASTYPVADYVPVGVVAYPQNDDAILGPTGEITFIGLNWLDRNNPDNGSANFVQTSSLGWGYTNFDIPELTDYTVLDAAITDMNGKANTQAVLQYATAPTDWRTASAITYENVEGNYCLFECSWRYHTSGTAQGDWYIPALGQVYYLHNEEVLNKLNSGRTMVGASEYKFVGNPYGNLGSSTECNAGSAWNWWGQTNFRTRTKSTANDFPGCPFCNKLMTRI